MTWTSAGHQPWQGQGAITHDGFLAGQSGTIANNQNSYLESSVTGPGTLKFWWKVSSEANFDKLIFYRGGTEQFNISGSIDWQQKTVAIPAGTYAVKWSYTKDGSSSVGSDAGWLDQVEWIPTATVTFYAQGGQFAGASSTTNITYTRDQSYNSFPTVTHATLIFAAWTNVTGIIATKNDLVLSPTNLYARWVSLPDQLPFTNGAWNNYYDLPDGTETNDADDDKVSNYAEWLIGTVPTNAADKHLTVLISATGGTPRVTWIPDLGAARTYRLEGKDLLSASSWNYPTNSTDTFFRLKVSYP